MAGISKPSSKTSPDKTNLKVKINSASKAIDKSSKDKKRASEGVTDETGKNGMILLSRVGFNVGLQFVSCPWSCRINKDVSD